MKNKTLSVASILILMLFAVSCNSSDDNQAEPENLEAAAAMTASLARMGAENDSLVIHHSGPMYHHHDSIYHHQDSIYVHEHINYHHGDTIHHNPQGHHNETQHHEHDSIATVHHQIAH